LFFPPGAQYTYKIESNDYSASLPYQRSSADKSTTVSCRIDAGNLLKALRGLGDVTQLTFPFHPQDGLKYHTYNPIYINGDATDRFAILAQCGDIQERMRIDAERSGVITECSTHSNSSTG